MAGGIAREGIVFGDKKGDFARLFGEPGAGVTNPGVWAPE